jgi:hypothetical protein
MQKPTMKTAPPSSATEAERSLEDQIRIRAHELYDARGREDGHDVEDWVHAEAEIKSRTLRAAA